MSFQSQSAITAEHEKALAEHEKAKKWKERCESLRVDLAAASETAAAGPHRYRSPHHMIV